MNYWLLILPILGALIGWVIHSIAAQYLISTILPRKKQQIATALGRLAAVEFQAYQGIEEKVNDPQNLESVLPVIETHVDGFLNEKLKKEMPMISMFIGSKTTDKLKEVFMTEIRTLFPQVIGKFASNLKSSIDLEKIISEKINAINDQQISNWVNSSAGTQIKYFKLLGLITGLVVGTMTVVVAVLTT